MPKVTVVAIPRVDDRVWKVSSEKVPHMTLLFLGDVDWDASDLIHVAEYVQHASSMLNRFGMSVDRRGTLGEDQADVLFFSKDWYYMDAISKFRDGLLADDTINAAYNATEQFPEWIPHLTLGFPETPAHPDERDWPIGYVEFDKIGLWVGEYTGVEFELMSEESRPMMAMGEAVVSEMLSLAHYGVKGMKWGVRKKRTSSSTERTHFKKAPARLTDDELRRRVERMQTEVRYNQLNKRDVSRGQALVVESLTNSGRKILTSTVTRVGMLFVTAAIARATKR